MSTTAKAHGMDGTLVDPDWPPLTLDEVRALLSQFPRCGEPVEILTVSPRPFSAASVVATRAAGASSSSAITARCAIAKDCSKSIASWSICARTARRCRASSRPHPARRPSRCGEWTYEVHETPAGRGSLRRRALLDAVSHRGARAFRGPGAGAAASCSARLRCSARANRVRWWPASRSSRRQIPAARDGALSCSAAGAGRRCGCTRRDCEQALELLAPFHAELLPLLPALPPLWTHNDLHASNLFWSDAGDDAQATAIIDFGLADRTNAVHDLAQAIERNIVEWLDAGRRPDAPGRRARASRSFAGAARRATNRCARSQREEAAALAPMTALCHAEFALTEADYFLGVLHSEEKARLASDGLSRGPCALVPQRRRRKAAGCTARLGRGQQRSGRESRRDELDGNRRITWPRTGWRLRALSPRCSASG